MSASELARRLFFEWSERGMCEHLETFHAAAEHYGAPTIIELGVRTGVSSALWLSAIEQRGAGWLWSVDLEEPHGDYVEDILGHPSWTFNLGDDTDPEIVEQAPYADVLFIDTSHTFAHTFNELEIYVPKLQPEGTVMLHDSNVRVTDADDPEPYSVRRAINSYIELHPEWKVDESTDRFGLDLMFRA